MAGRNSYIGKQIGNYRIVKEIPGGGFASVFLGQHIVFTDRPIVAIKLLHAHEEILLGSISSPIQNRATLRRLFAKNVHKDGWKMMI